MKQEEASTWMGEGAAETRVGPISSTVSLEADLEECLGRLRSALAALIAAVPGGVRKAADVHKSLGLTPALGWAIYKVATAERAMAVGPYLPTAAAAERVLRAAAKAGVPRDVVGRAKDEFDRFEELVQLHADDRETFDVLLRDLAGDEAGVIDLKERRAAYRVNTRIWGEQCKVILGCTLLQPSATPGMIDAVLLRGYIDLVRTRRRASQSTASFMYKYLPENGAPEKDLTNIQPLVRDTERPEYSGIMTEFCSRPLPSIRTYVDENNYTCTELNLDQLGKTGATTFFVAQRLPCFMTAPLVGQEPTGFPAFIMSSTELFVRDILVHESLWNGRAPEVGIYGGFDPMQNSDSSHKFKEEHRLNCGERIVDLGKGIDAMHSPDLPRHGEIVRRVFEAIGKESQRFRTFRCRLEYPLYHTCLRIVFDR